MVVKSFGVGERFGAVEPLALVERRGVERERAVRRARGGRSRTVCVRGSWGRHQTWPPKAPGDFRFLVEPAVILLLGTRSLLGAQKCRDIRNLCQDFQDLSWYILAFLPLYSRVFSLFLRHYRSITPTVLATDIPFFCISIISHVARPSLGPDLTSRSPAHGGCLMTLCILMPMQAKERIQLDAIPLSSVP